MLYLLCGLDHQSKDQKIFALKEKFFSSPESLTFDFQTLYAPQLDLDTLKKSLITLPVFSPKKIVIIRQAEKLKSNHHALITELLAATQDFLVLVFDTQSQAAGEQLRKVFDQHLETLCWEQKKERTVFDLSRLVAQRKKTEALKILSELLAQASLPVKIFAPNIIGVILWEWKKKKQKLAAEQFCQGLTFLEEADFQIKRSRLRPEYALEILVIKLCSLEGG